MTTLQLTRRRHRLPRRRRSLHRGSTSRRIWETLEAHAGEWWTLDALAAVITDADPRAIARAVYRLAENGLVRRGLAGGAPASGTPLAVFGVPDRDTADELLTLYEAGLRLCRHCPQGFPTENGRDQHERRWCTHAGRSPW